MQCNHCHAPWDDDGWVYCPVCHRNYSGALYPAKQTEQELRDIDRLQRRIRAAFAGVTLGGGMSLAQAHLEGAYSDEAVYLAARAKDPETDWTEVPGWKIDTGHSTLSFLDPEGWRFYIPAFLSWSLANWRDSDSLTPQSVIWSLANAGDPWEKRYALLTGEQSRAILDFLEFFERYADYPEDRYDARKATEAYWHRFEERT